MNSIIEESWDFYKTLYNNMVQSTKNVLNLSKLVD